MTRTHRSFRTALLLVILTSGSAHAQCPSNPIYSPHGQDPQAYSNEIYSSCFLHPPAFPGAADDCADRGKYDLHAGTTSITAGYTGTVSNENIFHCFPGDYFTLPVTDQFTLTGPASGVPLAFEARLRITGRRDTGPEVGRVAFSAATDSVVFDAPVSPNIDEQLVLHLHQRPGEPFVLLVRPAASGFCLGSVSLRTTLTFALPAGYGITSCHGYAAAVVTTAVRRTWGQVKTSYR